MGDVGRERVYSTREACMKQPGTAFGTTKNRDIDRVGLHVE